MREYVRIVTGEGQIALPTAVRNALRVRTGDAVTLTIENGHVRLEAGGGVVERTAGAIKSDVVFSTAEEERAAAEQAIADAAMERMGE